MSSLSRDQLAQDPERACVSVKVQKEKKSPSPSSRTVRQEECSVTPWRACLSCAGAFHGPDAAHPRQGGHRLLRQQMSLQSCCH